MEEPCQAILNTPKTTVQASDPAGSSVPAEDNAQQFLIQRKPLRNEHDLPTLNEELYEARPLLSGELEVTKLRNSPNSLTSTYPQRAQLRCGRSRETASPGKEILQPAAKLWNPFWLQTSTLIGFMVLFAALSVALILLSYFSKLNHGFNVQETTNRYTYTYAPTAVLIILVSLWRQLDYYCKCLIPWEHLRKGEARVSESLLLDYISPMQLTSFVLAIKRKDFVVVSTVLGFFFLKLTVFLSTGLLAVVPTRLETSDIPLGTTTRLIEHLNGSEVIVTSAPADAYYGTLAYGLAFSEGSANGIAFSNVAPVVDIPETVRLRTELDAFVPRLDCENVTISDLRHMSTSNNAFFGNSTLLEAKVETSTCHFNHNLLLRMARGYSPSRSWAPSLIPVTCDGYTVADLCPMSAAHYSVKNVTHCGFTLTEGSRHQAGPFGADHTRWLFIMLDVSYAQTLNMSSGSQTAGNVINSTSNLNGIAAVLCKPSYSIERVNVILENPGVGTRRGVSVSLPEIVSNKTIPGLSSERLSSFVMSSLGNLSLFNDMRPNPSPGSELPNVVFEMMSQVGNASNFSSLLDANTMANSARMIFTNVAAQVAKEYFMVPGTQHLQGRVSDIQSRLVIQDTAMWSMVAVSAVMVMLTGFVLMQRPRGVVTRDPDSIGGTAALLATSKNLQVMLSNTGHAETKVLRSRLAAHRYSTLLRPQFRIQTRRNAHWESSVPPHFSGHHWRPWAVHKIGIYAILVAPSTLVIILGLLQRASNSHDGFLSIPNSLGQSFYSKASTNYIPALVMLLLATLFSSLDFTVSIITPFSALLRGNTRSDRSILRYMLGITPPQALLGSLRAHYWGVFSSILAGLVGSTLTVVVSGLYIIERSSKVESMSLHRLDSFNWDWSDSLYNDRHASEMLRFMEYANMSYPKFTHGVLAFPDFRLDSSTEDLSSATLSVNLPAWRASLDCDAAPVTRIEIDMDGNVTHTPSSYEWHAPRITVYSDAPYRCRIGKSAFIARNSLNGTEFGNPDDFGHGPYFGRFQDLYIGDAWKPYDTSKEDEVDWRNMPDCPSLRLVFGIRANEVEDTSTEDVTVLLCHQHLEEIETMTELVLPDLLIDSKKTPIPDESTIKHVKNSTYGGSNFFYTAPLNFNWHVPLSDRTFSGGSFSILTSFVDAMVKGKDGIPAEELAGPQNVDRLKNATNHLYQKYMAQAISLNMRTINNSETLNETFNATLSGATTLRLKQNAGPKLALQILLGVMTVCGSAAYFFTDMRHTLPHNPCTIAGRMSLLADSEMLKLIPKGAEYMSDKELEKKVFGKHRYGMGWFDNGAGGRRFGIDIGKAQVVRRRNKNKWISRLRGLFRRSQP